MLGFLFGFGKNKIKDALKKGAVIIDVRTPHEFDQGKVPDSVNIPVDRIALNNARIKAMNKPIVLCCESGNANEFANIFSYVVLMSFESNGGFPTKQKQSIRWQ